MPWMESARLWVALIGPPSTKKSPILRGTTARVSLANAAEDAAFDGFACVKRALAECKIRNIKDAKIASDMTVALAEAATVMRERGLAGAMPLLEGPYTAAQLANGGNDPIAKALEGLFLEPPDSA